MDRADAMRAVQTRFAGSNPELANGFAEHGPMGAEAMLSLGLDPASVVRWAERHHPEPVAADSPTRAIYDHLRAEFDSGDWRATAARIVDRHAGGLDSHLFHGLIRTAHAVRALEHDDHASSRAELATGLTAWRVWDADQPRSDPDWVGGDPIEFVIDAARRGSAAFVQKPSIVTIHAVTAPMAFLLIAGLVGPETHERVAAVFARTHRRYPAAPTDLTAISRPGPEALAGLVTHWDAHPAKLVEAALRGHDLTGHPVFLHAATAMLR